MRRPLSLLLLSLLWLSGPTVAEEKTLLLIPFEMQGSYKPLDSQAMANQLKIYIEKAAPETKITIATSSSAMLDAKQAAQLGRQAGTDYVMFGDLRLRHESKVASLSGGPSEGYPGGSGMPSGWSSRYMVTVAGVAHGSLVESQTGELIIDDESILLLENEMTGAVKDGPVMQELEKRLSEKCVQEMAKSLIERMRVSLKKKTAK